MKLVKDLTLEVKPLEIHSALLISHCYNIRITPNSVLSNMIK